MRQGKAGKVFYMLCQRAAIAGLSGGFSELFAKDCVVLKNF